ncbi:PIN domain-containing protein [Scytonema sp. UIC 10036]|uniref:PIN domain-containing protein n=1 Tax=Scytonema sp. UIC 10036 TaxID=2304196 RepID=UPI001A9BBAB9|nr:PIN domain-containing protein [Scytonema sp. UIC 10036]
MAAVRKQADEMIKQRAKQLEQQGLKAIDALHVASAEASECDYFITSDKRLINRCQKLNFRVINTTDFILEVEDEYQGT